ncbi:M28 family peptidase [uncultured Eudoraea sp.]|uniref:M28 family peptidase n=1 Tax=uncultured Eudoraea sp. TaxID=1035614 RepID=UPI002621632D|nr:M28 family peptidase [uncultured Eudoraea sp.]
MKNSVHLLSFLLILLAIYLSFDTVMPKYKSDLGEPATVFSTDRALKHVEAISKQPHGVGFDAHETVKKYILDQLSQMGLETTTQKGYTIGDWNNFSKAENIIARIKGSQPGKALMLLSHYDSSPHSSLGASDAASGVATILEGIRAYLASETIPKNDILILISDAEELGLNGADLFVNSHPWAKDVGLVLNFEARGSGGQSYMLIETNRGNEKLIEEFTLADPDFPVANSLAYSIYKLLPNDTDLTVFREDRDIEGFNFAFFDDHYDYHTALDTYERLDRNSLAHQGSYVMPLLHHFSQTDLTDLKSLNDSIYFNVPLFKLISYPFDWIWPMFYLALVLTFALLFYGFKMKRLNLKEIGIGFLPLLFVLAINGIVGWYGWSVLNWIYPHYNDILHGFTYNGHKYIIAFVLFSIGTCFLVYHRYRKISIPSLLVAPLIIWLAICWGLASYLPGASYFILPIYALLGSLLISLQKEKSNPYFLVALTLPAIWLYAPFIQMFPTGLGLKMLVTSTVLTTLTFLLLYPVFGAYKHKNRIASLFFLLFLGFMVSGHLYSSHNSENPEPTSLLYILNTDKNRAQWATYENELSSWTSQYLGENKKRSDSLPIISSKYNTGFSYVADAPIKEILPPKVEVIQDTLIGGKRVLEFCISPQRDVNRLDVFTNESRILEAKINNVALSDYYLANRKGGKLITHFISNNDYTEIQLSIPEEESLELTLYEASNDLLDNPSFSVPQRAEEYIPMPFVLNDAVLLIKTIKF